MANSKTNDFSGEFRRLERELRALKSASIASPLVVGYQMEIAGEHIGRYRIDYADGNQPIVSENLTYSSSMSYPVGNSQYLWVFAQYQGFPILVISNRKILQIVYDPE